MHPARSLVASTTLSGMGFGLMAWLGMLPTGHPGWVAAVFALLAYALAGCGLLAALRDPGRRHRFLEAFARQPTSPHASRHAREAWLAAATMAGFAVYVAGWLALDARPATLGWLVTVLAVATVASMSMTCARQPAAARWNAPLAAALFLAAALAGGALLAGSSVPAIWSLAALALLQPAFWLATDRRGAGTPPTVVRIGRRRALALRLLGLTCAALLPLALLLAYHFKHGLAALIVAVHITGMVALRWLFYADAAHEVGLRAEMGRDRPPCRPNARSGEEDAARSMTRTFETETRRSPGAMRGESGQPPRLQVGALCWRRTSKGALRVLLITSRNTGRWVIPKGWPMRNRTEAEAAAREAFEEAGVTGEIATRSLGLYSYSKVLARGRSTPCVVRVFPLAVRERLSRFPEAEQRKLKWFSPAKAARKVREPELARILRAFNPGAAHEEPDPAPEAEDGAPPAAS
jgi:sulfite dehydrogenase (quinone) subunit SoeC